MLWVPYRSRLTKCGCLLAMLLFPLAANCCDTPVYRYAMYRWFPAPFEIYFFHDEPVTAAQADLHEMLRSQLHAEGPQANVAFLDVDLTAENVWEGLPPDVKQAFDAHGEPSLPCYLVLAPPSRTRLRDRGEIHFGDLDSTTAESLLDSTARKQTAEQLEQGKCSVLVMLTSGNQEADDEAEQVVKEVVEAVRAGEISLGVPPLDIGDDPTAEPGRHEVGFLKVARDDPHEQWLVQSLLAVEDGLSQETLPLVFVVFGRGRALPPYIGSGIRRDNLQRELEFISGACSCTVKEQNPGMDLLVRYDWEKAAGALAEKFGAEEGNESMVSAADFFPNLIIPTRTPDEKPDQPGTASQPTEPDPASEQQETGQNVIAQVTPSSEDQATDPAAVTDTERASADQASTDQASTAPVPAPPVPPAARSLNGVLIVAAGVGLAMVLLFGATFMILRPR